MQVRSRAELQLPGSCYVCGSGNCDDGYVDFGTFVDYHGNFYLCVTCAEQLAETIGWIHPDIFNQVTKGSADVRDQLRSTESELADARREIDSLRVVLSSSLVAGNDFASSKASAAFELQQQGIIPTPFAAATSGESESEESDSGKERPRIAGPKSRNLTSSGNGK